MKARVIPNLDHKSGATHRPFRPNKMKSVWPDSMAEYAQTNRALQVNHAADNVLFVTGFRGTEVALTHCAAASVLHGQTLPGMALDGARTVRERFSSHWRNIGCN